jgi:hypothetical protein
LFNYAIIASWNEPLPSPPQSIPDDFPMNANSATPIHVALTDYSTLYYLDGSSFGGDLILEAEIFDWTQFFAPGTLRNKLSRVVVESRDGLIQGNHWEATPQELVFQPGDTLNSLRMLITVPGTPIASGMTDLLVAIEIDSDSGYYQGYGETAPDADMAIYLRPFIEIDDCPAAMIGNMSTFQASEGDDMKSLDLYGSGFVAGSQLSIRLMDSVTDEVIHCLETEFVDSTHIKTTFNFNGIEPGVFNIVCTNGCGTESTPPDNLTWWDGKFKIVGTTPYGVTPSTGRIGPYGETVDSLSLNWPNVLYAQSYRIYVDENPFSEPGPEGLIEDLQLLAVTTMNHYTHNASSPVPFNNHSSYSYVVRSFYDIGTGNGESSNSNIVIYSGQDFDGSDWGEWGYIKQNEPNISWKIESDGFSGEGFYFEADVNTVGYPTWLVMHSPRIPYLAKATNVKFEFNHRFEHFYNQDGYFVGFTNYMLPTQFQGTVYNVHPIPEAAYGAGYTDAHSTVLQQEFGLSSSYVQNYSSPGGGWWGWYLSGFDASDALASQTSFYVIIGMGLYDDSTHKFNLDDCALLVY